MVAISEGVLFMLWSNPDLPYDLKKKWYATLEERDKGEDEQQETELTIAKAPAAVKEEGTLRQRHR